MIISSSATTARALPITLNGGYSAVQGFITGVVTDPLAPHTRQRRADR